MKRPDKLRLITTGKNEFFNYKGYGVGIPQKDYTSLIISYYYWEINGRNKYYVK